MRSFSPNADRKELDNGNQYEVNAPSGKLFIILKSQEGDGIIIEMVSEASPLAELVGVGDRLVRIDEIEVLEHSAAAVNQILKARRKNTLRKLFFVKKSSSDASSI